MSFKKGKASRPPFEFGRNIRRISYLNHAFSTRIITAAVQESDQILILGRPASPNGY
jgi:hypothetical protein